MTPQEDIVLLHDAFEASLRRCPDKVAVVCQGARTTYRELDAMAVALGRLLASRGVARGDRVLLFLENGPEMVAAIYAVLRMGAVFVPVNPLTKRDKLAYMMRDTRGTAIVAHGSLAAVWREPVAGSGHLRACVVVGAAGGGGLPACTVGWPAPEEAAAERCGATIDEDLAAIIYTSGSTGDPKGVMLTHLNMVCASRSVATYLGLRDDDVILCVLPLAFDYGLYQVLMAVRVGATVVLERSFAFPIRTVEILARERITVLPGVPTVFAVLMDLPATRAADLSALRLITNTAAALPEEHIRELRALFPHATLFSMYGLTECKRVTYLPPDQLEVRPGSVGRGMPNEEVWLVDDTGRRLPNGSTGELVIRGSNVMRGYWEKPAETAQRLRPGALPGETLLYSGDIFRTDAEGWLYFVARKDDIIKSRGEKVSPREVENAICALEGVREAAVIGIADPVLGEAVKAFVVLREGAVLTGRDVIRHCLGRLESFMAPKVVEIVASLPKTDTGKVKKAALA